MQPKFVLMHKLGRAGGGYVIGGGVGGCSEGFPPHLGMGVRKKIEPKIVPRWDSRRPHITLVRYNNNTIAVHTIEFW